MLPVTKIKAPGDNVAMTGDSKAMSWLTGIGASPIYNRD